MPVYKAPIKDFHFALHDVLKVEPLYASLPGFEHATRDIFDAVLDEAARLSPVPGIANTWR